MCIYYILLRRKPSNDLVEDQVAVEARLGANEQHVFSLQIQRLLHLLDGRVDVGCLQIDFVQYWYDVNAGLEGQKEVGYRLRLHALRGVYDQQAALARFERT